LDCAISVPPLIFPSSFSTNVITPDLFQLGSPSRPADQQQKQVKDRINSTFAGSTLASPSSSGIMSGLGNLTIGASSASSSDASPIFVQQRQTTGINKKNLLESTLRQLQDATQAKYQQIRRNHMNKR